MKKFKGREIANAMINAAQIQYEKVKVYNWGKIGEVSRWISKDFGDLFRQLTLWELPFQGFLMIDKFVHIIVEKLLKRVNLYDF